MFSYCYHAFYFSIWFLLLFFFFSFPLVDNTNNGNNFSSSDFSVSTRLLPSVEAAVPHSTTFPTYQHSYISPHTGYPSSGVGGGEYTSPQPPHGWQFLLPSDMGTTRGHPQSTSHYQAAPNAAISLLPPPPPYQSLSYGNGYPQPNTTVHGKNGYFCDYI